MPSRSYPLRTLVADDHRLFRQGLVSLINARPDLMQVVGEVENGQDAVACCEQLHPDLVLLDIFMPVMDGLQAARRILASRPETIVIMLTASGANQHLEDAMALGVSGYLPKSLDADELFSLVRAAVEGGVAVTHATALRLLRHVGHEVVVRVVGQFDLRDPVVQVRCPLVRLAAEEAVELVEALARGPAVIRP